MEKEVVITRIFPVETIQGKSNGKTYQKGKFWGEDRSNPLYPVTLEFELFGENDNKTKMLKGHIEGETVKVAFNIKGNPYPREAPDRIYTSLDVWQISSVEGAPVVSGSDQAVADINNMPDPMDGSNDLPF